MNREDLEILMFRLRDGDETAMPEAAKLIERLLILGEVTEDPDGNPINSDGRRKLVAKAAGEEVKQGNQNSDLKAKWAAALAYRHWKFRAVKQFPACIQVAGVVDGLSAGRIKNVLNEHRAEVEVLAVSPATDGKIIAMYLTDGNVQDPDLADEADQDVIDALREEMGSQPD